MSNSVNSSAMKYGCILATVLLAVLVVFGIVTLR